MSTTSTPNLGLVKPTLGTGEHADVSVINDNMDKIDAAVGDLADEDSATVASGYTVVKHGSVAILIANPSDETTLAVGNNTLGQLPASFVPKETTVSVVQVDTNYAQLIVSTDGYVRYWVNGASPITGYPRGQVVYFV